MPFNKPNVNTVWAGTGAVISPALAKINQGWIAEIPDYEFENWIQNRQDQFNAHINQFGIPVWDATTEYIANKSYVQGSDGEIYRALTTHTNSDPIIASANWVRAFNSFDTSYSKAEADGRFLNETNNLSDLTNIATARTNLGVYSKTEGDARYLLEANNLSDLTNTTTARTNLGVYGKTEVYTKAEANNAFLDAGSNLSDLVNAATARANLGVYSTTESDARYLNEASNLSDLANVVTARANLSVYSKAEGDARYLLEANNLSDLTNTTTARTNLNVYSKAEVYTRTESDGRYVNSTGDTMTGKLTLDGDPTSALHAVTKQYVDVGSTPVGSVITFASQTLPSGFLKCNGAAVSRATYSDLFAIIGTTFGAGNGSTTFNLPDLRGTFIRGWDDGRSLDPFRIFGSYQSDDMRGHTHTGFTEYGGSHSHNYTKTNYANTNNGNIGLGADGPEATYSTTSAGNHRHEFTTNSVGGLETRPRNVALLFCIKF